MSEWWTYSLSSFLLFSARTYYRLFELTNADVWPLQIVTLAAGLAIPVLVVRGAASGGRVVAAILAALWLFVAWAYMLQRYDPINFAARYYAIGFAIQAGLLIWTGVIRDRLHFDPPRWIGIPLIIYALVLQPLIAPLSGRPWTQAEIFGLAPDPTVVATLGVFVAAARPNWLLLILPLLWCVISGLTLWAMESPEAPILPLAAAVAVGLAAWKTLTFRAPPDG